MEQQIITRLFLTQFGLVCSLIFYSALIDARIKCWENTLGVRECGDKVPPEFTQQGYYELDRDGVIRSTRDRAKTIEELKEEKRIAKIVEQEEKIKKKQEIRDRTLLDTFASVSDIEKARDSRISTLEANIKVIKLRNNKIKMKLDDHNKYVEKLKKQERTVSADFTKNIESLKKQINKNNKFVKERMQEKERIIASHEADIERFKVLKKIK